MPDADWEWGVRGGDSPRNYAFRQAEEARATREGRVFGGAAKKASASGKRQRRGS